MCADCFMFLQEKWHNICAQRTQWFRSKAKPIWHLCCFYCFCYCWEWRDLGGWMGFLLLGWGFFGFMVHWIKELCNLLSNVQFIHIFHLLKLYLLSSIQQVPTICSLSNRNIPVSPPLLSVCQRYKSFQNSSSSSPENLFMWYNNYKNKYIANDGLNSGFFSF